MKGCKHMVYHGHSRIVPISGIAHESGHCYKATLRPDFPAGDTADGPALASADVLEDGLGLGPGHMAHDAIRESGGGRFSHWHDTLYFSTSDNTDPRTN